MNTHRGWCALRETVNQASSRPGCGWSASWAALSTCGAEPLGPAAWEEALWEEGLSVGSSYSSSTFALCDSGAVFRLSVWIPPV